MTAIGIFHENFAQHGGAERVAESMARLFPAADVLSTVAVPSRLSAYMGGRGIRTTWMQALPGLDRWYRYYVPLYPFAVRTSRTGGYGFVLSSCFRVCQGPAWKVVGRAAHLLLSHTSSLDMARRGLYVPRGVRKCDPPGLEGFTLG